MRQRPSRQRLSSNAHGDGDLDEGHIMISKSRCRHIQHWDISVVISLSAANVFFT